MATTAQIDKLRRKLQDFYDQAGAVLQSSDQAFNDTELGELIDDGFLEVSLGERTSVTAIAEDGPLADLLARVDGLLMLAQDESRRTKWDINNKVVDPTKTSDQLIACSRELRSRYDQHMNRKLKRDSGAGLDARPAGGILRFNNTVASVGARDFNNKDIRRNTPRH